MLLRSGCKFLCDLLLSECFFSQKGSRDSHARIRYGESINLGRDLMKPVYFFLGANSEEGFFSL